MDEVKVDEKWYYTATFEELMCWKRLGFASEQGIIFDEELAGPNGMDFILFPARWHTAEDVEATKNWLRSTRDVVNIYVGMPSDKYPLTKEIPHWSPERKERAFRRILETRQANQVDDVILVDIVTARAVCLVLDGLNPLNKQKYLAYPATKMAEIAWGLVE